MDKLMDKALTLGISLAGGYVASKAFEFAWQQITGDEAPKKGDDESLGLKKALIFTVSSAAISAGVQVLSERGAKAGVRKLKSAYGKPSEV